MDSELRVLKCPTCGAPIDSPEDEQGRLVCKYCGTIVERAGRPKEPEKKEPAIRERVMERQVLTPVVTITPLAAPQVGKAARSVGCFMVWLVVAVVALVGAGVFFVINRPTGGNIDQFISSGPVGPRVYSIGFATVIPSDNDTTPDVIASTYSSDEIDRLVYLDWEGQPVVRWAFSPLPEDASSTGTKIASDSNHIFFNYKTRLVALSRADGTTAWEASLSDETSYACNECFRVLGDRLVVLTNNGTLSAYDTGSGKLAWSARLSSTPSHYAVVNGNPALIDEASGQTVGFAIWDAATGTLIDHLVPTCPNEPFPEDPQELNLFSPVVVDPEGTSVYLAFGFFPPGCIQRWDTAAGTPVWQTVTDISNIRSVDEEDMLAAPEALYFVEDDNIHMVAAADGAFRTLYTDPDYTFGLVGAREGVLVVQVERTRGTRRYELWGLDTATGQRLWQFLPLAEDVANRPTNTADEKGIWSAGFTSEGVTIFQLFANPARMALDTLGLKDGVSAGQKTVSLSNSTSTIWVQSLLWTRNQLWLKADAQVVIIDVASGTKTISWP